MKLLLVLLAILFGIWLWRSGRNASNRNKHPDPKASPPGAPTKQAQDMLAVHRQAWACWQRCRDSGLDLDTLSMGMSADITEAIAAGSTMVRVGTAIFGRRG